ncbi:MAG: Apurinic endonuclease-redox protein [Actinomycetia bacterium]|nr:Apurinic endonuclease-redox protein [Actinomycetes bacterium]
MSAEILEEGRIYFFNRPRVGRPEVDDLEDVQRLHMVLRPRGNRFRVMVIGRKRLPVVEEAPERLRAG